MSLPHPDQVLDDPTRKALVAEARSRYAIILGDDIEIDDDSLVSLVEAADDRADGYERVIDDPTDARHGRSTVRGWVQGWFYVDHVPVPSETPNAAKEQPVG